MDLLPTGCLFYPFKQTDEIVAEIQISVFSSSLVFSNIYTLIMPLASSVHHLCITTKSGVNVGVCTFFRAALLPYFLNGLCKWCDAPTFLEFFILPGTFDTLNIRIINLSGLG